MVKKEKGKKKKLCVNAQYKYVLRLFGVRNNCSGHFNFIIKCYNLTH